MIIITKKDKMYEPIYFAAKVVDQKAIREQLKYMQVKNRVLTGLTSYRVHQIDNIDLEDGFYLVKKATKNEIYLEYTDKVVDFPDIEEVKPSMKGYFKIELPEIDFLTLYAPEIFVANFIINTNIGMNCHYLMDIYPYAKTAYFKEEGYAVVFEGNLKEQHNIYVLIMPLVTTRVESTKL